MQSFTENPIAAALIGIAAAIALVIAAVMATRIGGHDAGVLLVRVAHVAAAMVWAGFIVFVNLVQLAALKAASDAERPVIVRHVVARTTRVFAIAADVTLLTGVVMLVPLLATLTARPLLLLGVLGGIAMWVIVRFVLKPAVARVTGTLAVSDAERAAARATIALWARINLALVLPVTVAMLLAGHGLA